MIDKQRIEDMAIKYLDNEELFIVDIVISGGNDIELTIDSDTRVTIDECVRISRAIDNELEESGEDDFSLIVTSAGIGNPLKHKRQFAKCKGKTVDVVLKDGRKITGVMTECDDEGVTVTYESKVAVEGKKRKELQEFVEQYSFEAIKSVCEVLMIK